MFFSACAACSPAVSPASSPVAGSMPSWPDTNTNPLALTAWLYAPSAAGASEVATASIFSLILCSSRLLDAWLVHCLFARYRTSDYPAV